MDLVSILSPCGKLFHFLRYLLPVRKEHGSKVGGRKKKRNCTIGTVSFLLSSLGRLGEVSARAGIQSYGAVRLVTASFVQRALIFIAYANFKILLIALVEMLY